MTGQPRMRILCVWCQTEWTAREWPMTFRHLSDWMREARCPGCGEPARCLELIGLEDDG